jgi:hypothetical protein
LQTAQAAHFVCSQLVKRETGRGGFDQFGIAASWVSETVGVKVQAWQDADWAGGDLLVVVFAVHAVVAMGMGDCGEDCSVDR